MNNIVDIFISYRFRYCTTMHQYFVNSRATRALKYFYHNSAFITVRIPENAENTYTKDHAKRYETSSSHEL